MACYEPKLRLIPATPLSFRLVFLYLILLAEEKVTISDDPASFELFRSVAVRVEE